MGKYYLAVDIGASSGRHILAELRDGQMILQEVHRFQNGMEEKNGALCWDIEHLFSEIKAGMKKCGEIGKIPVSVSVDTWGVDFVLSADGRDGSQSRSCDSAGRTISSYRNPETVL